MVTGVSMAQSRADWPTSRSLAACSLPGAAVVMAPVEQTTGRAGPYARLDACVRARDACLRARDACLRARDACLRARDACLRARDASLRARDDDDDSPADAAFRAEARAWLAAHVGPYRTRYDPANPSLVFADVSDTDHVARGKAWQRVLHEGGYAGLGWPEEYGGRDLPLSQRVIWAQETAAAGAPPGINLIGEGMVGPDPAGPRHRRAEAPVPAARSSAATRSGASCSASPTPAPTWPRSRPRPCAAGEDGGGWAVSGHKLWTSAAHYADWGILLARTDWDVPKHQGCTYFLVDMKAPGVTTRPAAADDRGCRLQRGVPRRGACARRSAGRGRGRRAGRWP